VIVFDLRNQGVILGEEEYRIGVVVTSLDVGDGVYVTVDGLGRASVRRVATMEGASWPKRVEELRDWHMREIEREGRGKRCFGDSLGGG
jgi:hypothetical protein